MLMIGKYVIDAALNEEHSNEAEASEFPIEDRSNFNDNLRIKPKRYRMNGLVTDTPLDQGFRSIETDGSEVVDTSTLPTAQAKQALEALFEAKQPMTIVTDRATLKDMAMISLVFAQDPDTGDSLPFTAVFQKFNVVENVRRTIKVKFVATDLGSKAAHPPGWIGTDKLGRDIVVDENSKGPGVTPRYIRADGTDVPAEEAADASRRTRGAVLVKYDKDGNAIPVDNKDYQPYTPRQKTPFWSPQSRFSKAPFPNTFGG